MHSFIRRFRWRSENHGEETQVRFCHQETKTKRAEETREKEQDESNKWVFVHIFK